MRKMIVLTMLAILMGGVPTGVADARARGGVSCGMQLKHSITLRTDLNCPNSDGIDVARSNVTISLNGHVLRGDNNAFVGIMNTKNSQHSIRVIGPGRIEEFGSAIGLDGTRMTVQNLVVVSGFGIGVAVNGTRARVSNVMVIGALIGFSIDASRVVLSDIQAIENGGGIQVTGSHVLIRRAVAAKSSIGAGINATGDDTNVENAITSQNAGAGLSATGANDVVSGVVAKDNVGAGINAPAATGSENLATGNTPDCTAGSPC